MKIHRFFTSEKVGENISITLTSESLVNQLRNVFRFSQGDEIIIFDNSGYDYLFTIEGYGKNTVTLKRKEIKENLVKTKKEIYLFASLVKKDNFEWIAQKATELGVSHIVPIMSERSEKKNLNIERIQKIIIEAAEQSGRATIPELHEIIDLKSALENYANIKSIAWDPSSIKFVSQDISDAVGLYIGPEGGWSPAELDLFSQNKISIRSLGPQVLKSETAVVAVISQFVF